MYIYIILRSRLVFSSWEVNCDVRQYNVHFGDTRHSETLLLYIRFKYVKVNNYCMYISDTLYPPPHNYTAARLIVADIDYNSNSSKWNFQYSPGYAKISDIKLLKLSSYKPIDIGKNDAHRGVRRQFDFKYYHLSSAIKNCVQILQIST